MFPLLFMPFQAGDGAAGSGSDKLDNLPLSYDLKCSEEFGVGAMNVSIQEKINIRENQLGKISEYMRGLHQKYKLQEAVSTLIDGIFAISEG